MLLALIVLRFDYTTVSAISILFGIVAIAAGVLEFGVLILAAGWWKLLHGVLAVVFIVTGIVAFVHPGNTFAALAAVFSFFLVIAGTFDIVISISVRREIDVWWVQLIMGIIEVVLGFWAAGYYGRSAVLLVAWVAAIAILRGIRESCSPSECGRSSTAHPLSPEREMFGCSSCSDNYISTRSAAQP